MSLLVVAGIVGIGGLLIAGSIAFYRWFYRVPAEAKVDSDVPRSKAAGREKTLRYILNKDEDISYTESEGEDFLATNEEEDEINLLSPFKHEASDSSTDESYSSVDESSNDEKNVTQDKIASSTAKLRQTGYSKNDSSDIAKSVSSNVPLRPSITGTQAYPKPFTKISPPPVAKKPPKSPGRGKFSPAALDTSYSPKISSNAVLVMPPSLAAQAVAAASAKRKRDSAASMSHSPSPKRDSAVSMSPTPKRDSAISRDGISHSPKRDSSTPKRDSAVSMRDSKSPSPKRDSAVSMSHGPKIPPNVVPVLPLGSSWGEVFQNGVGNRVARGSGNLESEAPVSFDEPTRTPMLKSPSRNKGPTNRRKPTRH